MYIIKHKPNQSIYLPIHNNKKEEEDKPLKEMRHKNIKLHLMIMSSLSYKNLISLPRTDNNQNNQPTPLLFIINNNNKKLFINYSTQYHKTRKQSPTNKYRTFHLLVNSSCFLVLLLASIE